MADGNIITNSEAPKRNFRWRAIVVMLGGILIHLTLGTYYTFGNFSPYIISYLRYRVGEKNRSNVDGLWVPNIAKVSQSIGNVVGGLLFTRFGTRISTTVGCAFFSGSVLLSYFTIQKSFIAFAATYGFVFGFGMFAAYTSTLTSVIKWMPNNPGLAGGIIVAGFGGGALVFNQAITRYINPHNKVPDVIEGSDRYFSDDDLLDRVPTSFLILGATYTVMQVIGIVMITSPPHQGVNVELNIPGRKDSYIKEERIQNDSFRQNDNLNDSNSKDEMDGEVIKDSSNGEHDIEKGDAFAANRNLKEYPTSIEKTEETKSEPNIQGVKSKQTVLQVIMITFRSRNFYIWLVVLFCMDCGMGFVTTLYKSYGQTFIQDDHFLALVGSCSSIFNCVGRPCWGALMDRFTFKVAMLCVTGFFASFTATFIASEFCGEAFFFVWVCAVYFSFCGVWIALPASLSNLYGADNMGINFGLVSVILIFSGIGTALLGTTLKELIGWHGIFLLSAGILTVGFIASFFFNDQKVTKR
ncbi:hypothetical protein ACJMK2_019427 [Sinanodonta woodiana]|uniref:Major facilitator superfamily (MFS) profile domain-containing protein n=1 Tax=Sinanodonta woodiana TaxID=1069815 RepID=A0ABD3UHT4_SINWO